MALIVLIHGIGQQGSTVEEQEAAWLPSLVAGVLASGHPNAAAVAARVAASTDRNRPSLARMAFYGDLYLPTDTQGDEVSASPAAEALAEVFAAALLARAAATLSAMTRGWQPRRRTRYARLIPIAMACKVWALAPAAWSPCWMETPG
jgi:hypothetical protein